MPVTPIVAVDLMADNVDSVIEGLVQAQQKYGRSVRLVAVGIKPDIEQLTEIVPGFPHYYADFYMEMGSKDHVGPRSSIAVCMQLVPGLLAQAVVSCGDTGKTVEAARTIIKTVSSVKGKGSGRNAVAIAQWMPTRNRDQRFLLLDIGANNEAKSEQIRDNALLGAVYASTTFGRTARVGLISTGSEPGKGTKVVSEVHDLLLELNGFGLDNDRPYPLMEYVGLIEGHDMFSGKVDVAVTDGATGNIVLKTVEGTAHAFGAAVKQELGIWRYLVGLGLRRVHQRFSWEEYNGAPLLGVDAPVFIGHGRSTPKAVVHAIDRAVASLEGNMNVAMAMAIVMDRKKRLSD